MYDHDFLFKAGHWLGEGTIAFSSSPERLHFYTRWQIGEKADGIIAARQEVEMRGTADIVVNVFTLSAFTDNSFAIGLQNDLLGKTLGKGIIDARTLAWEFREHSSFEGFEVYEKQDNGDYNFHAEYSSPDQFRTVIDGRVWLKAAGG